MKAFAAAICLLPVCSFSQERINDKPPSIIPLVAIPQLTGWVKNDIGQWKMGENSLPNANHERARVMPPCEVVLKMELYDVKYGGKLFYCFAKYTKPRFFKYGVWHTEYVADYWLFDGSTADTLIGHDTSVNYICFRTIARSMVEEKRPLSLSDLSDAIAEKKDDNIIGAKFCIKVRLDRKKNKVQFLPGSYDPETGVSDFEDCSVDDNDQLNLAYYELPEGVYAHFTSKIK